MPAQIIPVIMCGGAGTRLWPVSRESMPKQFVSLVGPTSTFQQVLARISDPNLFARPIIINQRRLPLRGGRAVARARHRGRHRARALAPRFRSRRRGLRRARGGTRLANPGKIPLELIEVQVGSYLGEDDIVRLDDVYGRERLG